MPVSAVKSLDSSTRAFAGSQAAQHSVSSSCAFAGPTAIARLARPPASAVVIRLFISHFSSFGGRGGRRQGGELSLATRFDVSTKLSGARGRGRAGRTGLLGHTPRRRPSVQAHFSLDKARSCLPGARTLGFAPVRQTAPATLRPDPKPLVCVSASVVELEERRYTVQATGAKNIAAVERFSGCMTVMLPALGDRLDAEALVERIDGLVLPGGRANVEPRPLRRSTVPRRRARRSGTRRDRARDGASLRGRGSSRCSASAAAFRR